MSINCISPKFLNDFVCLGDKCEDTCCKGWNMQLDNEMLEKYQTQAPELLEAVVGEPNKYIMKRDPSTDYCVKFDNGLCEIHKKYGDSFLGDACYFYPRATRAFGDKIMMTAALSCPEIARLTLFSEDAFETATHYTDHLPKSLRDYLPTTITSEQAINIHQEFINFAKNKEISPEQAIIKMFAACESLEMVNIASWADAAPFYLQKATLPNSELKETDIVYLLQAFCGLVVAAKKAGSSRLMQVIKDIEQALHVTIRMDNLAIVPLPDSKNAIQNLVAKPQEIYTPILRQYLIAQLSLACFPFGGFGVTLTQKIAVIGVRIATIKLALISAKATERSEIVRIVQTISRLLDHLADADFSLQIYGETGWLKKERISGLFAALAG